MKLGSGSTSSGSTENNSKWQYSCMQKVMLVDLLVMNIFNPAIVLNGQ